MTHHLAAQLAGRVFLFACALTAMPALPALGEEIPYGVPDKPWDEARGLHRARVQVAEKTDAVWAHLPWRRRDADADKKHIIVVDAATGQEVANLVRAAVTREAGDIVFQPATVPGEYHIYYLPHKVVGGVGWYSGMYLAPKETAQKEWVERHGLAPEKLAAGQWRELPAAKVLEFQARTAFDRFDPMEVCATPEEVSRLLAAHPDRPYLVFPEDRGFPIRMTDDLPARWITAGPSAQFRGEAQRNEYYAFQIGVYAVRADLEDLRADFSDLAGPGGRTIPAAALGCYNTGGRDWTGVPFRQWVTVLKGRVQALWCGVDVPRDAAPGEYRGTVTLSAKGLQPTKVDLTLAVADTVREDRGDAEPWRHSRLRWLDSTLAMDDEVVAPYTPMALDGRTVRCLGREVRLGDDGLPASIKSGGVEILAGPVTLVAETPAGPAAAAMDDLVFTKQAPGAVAWVSHGRAGALEVTRPASMEFDGYLHFEANLLAREAVDLKDVRLEIPVRREVAAYLMGMGFKGGRRPKEHAWKWGGRAYYDSAWIGDVRAGLQLELRGAAYSGPMVNLYWSVGQLKPPPAWDNGGKGGCTFTEEGDRVVVRATSGPRRLEKGDQIALEWAFLVTPVKPLDPAKHFRERYYHACVPVKEAVAAGANVINIHHATPLNPYINYPFIATDKLAAYTKEAHAAGAKVKIYYTVRELTNHVTEMWALRSLGHEIFTPGGAGGYPWLREHLVADYRPAWYHHFEDGDVCAAIVTSGESRWYNYYVEGLRWLMANTGIDGLYLDDVTYDRQILKRMRKVMDRARPGCLIDLHSNTAFSRGPANQYMEFFPYIDRLWFGEEFNYDDPPDYWLVEISGIPFGLMGEMLQGGGNPWRGMLYGMTARMPWSGDPRRVWKVWDEFGISDARMIGYWDAACPVRTGREDILATAYVRPGRTLVSVASWAPQAAGVRLGIDWKALGLDPAKAALRAPEIAGFQKAATFKADEEIPVEPKRGWLILVEGK
jgi:hypothetical protein